MKAAVGLFKFVMMFALGIANTLVGAFVLAKLWSWFIVGKVAGVPSMTYQQALGAFIVVGFLSLSCHSLNGVAQDAIKKDGVMAYTIHRCLVYIVTYGASLLMGYCWHLVLG